MRHLLVVASLLVVSAASGAEPPDEKNELPPIDVTGQPSPLNSDRTRFERQTPCLGCEAKAVAQESFLSRFLHFTVLPSEPPDDRDRIPISMTDQPLERFDVKQRP